MDKSKKRIDEINMIPDEIIAAVRAIGDETRLAILVFLIKEGEATFSQIKTKFGLNSSTLSHHLKILIQTALAENYYSKKTGTSDYSFYGTTSFGGQLVRSIAHVLDIAP